MKLISLKSGWKTYAVVLAGVTIGALQGLDQNGIVHAHIPAWIDWILGFLGAGTLRHGIQTQTATVIDNVLDALSQPQATVTTTVSAPGAPAAQITADDVARAVQKAMVDQRNADQAQADKTKAAVDATDKADSNMTHDEQLARLRDGSA